MEYQIVLKLHHFWKPVNILVWEYVCQVFYSEDFL
jgi:hypothetical protein